MNRPYYQHRPLAALAFTEATPPLPPKLRVMTLNPLTKNCWGVIAISTTTAHENGISAQAIENIVEPE